MLILRGQHQSRSELFAAGVKQSEKTSQAFSRPKPVGALRIR
jgi:hypothetical protein